MKNVTTELCEKIKEIEQRRLDELAALKAKYEKEMENIKKKEPEK